MHSGTAEECVSVCVSVHVCVCVYVCGRKRETDLSFLYKRGVVVLAQDVMRLLHCTPW